MSDPFSVAGSAVGVISLGLSICNAIIRYAQNAKGQSDDMKFLAAKASSVRSLMKNLRELIEETENDLPDVAEDLESKALGLQVHLDRLNRPIKQYERAQAVAMGLRSRARRSWETAIYHFKKEEILEVRDCLQSMEMDLNTALNVHSARELHRFGAKQDIFGLKQDLMIDKIDTLQLSIIATSHRNTLQQSKSHSISSHGSFSVQSFRTPVTHNWENAWTKNGRKQYSFYSKWLSRAFTGTFCLSTEPGIYPIMSLHCNAIVSPEGWLGTMYYEKGYFGHDMPWTGAGSSFLEKVDSWIQIFQFSVSEGKIRPTDELCAKHNNPFSGLHLSLLNLPFSFYGFFKPDYFPGICKYIKYMLNHNVTTNYRTRLSAFRKLCESFIWTEEVHNLASFVIERCGPINWAPRYWIEKRNMQSLLHRHEDSMDLPFQFMAVLRESERDLRNFLGSKLSHFEDTIDGVTLLQLAMGWPAGIRLLLQARSDMDLPGLYHQKYLPNITDKDDQINHYIDCCSILIESGYTIWNSYIVDCSSKILRSLFIRELVKRRRRLLDIAETHIHPSELSDLRNGETGLPDVSAPALCHILIAKGYKVDQEIASSEQSIFCYQHQSVEVLDEIYAAGFTDVDQPSEEGYTPLMAHCLAYFEDVTYMAIGWMISHGANPFRKIPGSNTTILHWINEKLAWKIQCRYSWSDGHFDPRVETRHFHQIDVHLFSLSTRDACYCSCSLDGCTPLSITVRSVVSHFNMSDSQLSQDASSFQKFLEYLLQRSQCKLEVCHAMIRSLTFDGLSLGHACCTELQNGIYCQNFRHESDLQEIREEQKLLLERFERLLSELYCQFDALGLPLMEFLQRVWYERMVKFLSERDKYDPEHYEKIRELGIKSWEMDEIQIPLVVQLICDQVRVVESDSEDS